MDVICLLTEYCSSAGIATRLNAPMAEYTTFRVGGAADILAMPAEEEAVAGLISFCLQNTIPYTVLGKGSNVLVHDEGIRGLVISTASLCGITEGANDTLVCLAGTPLIRLCTYALEHSLTGLEFAYGIPGSAGGAAYMNAGAYGGEMKDVLLACRYVNERGEIKELCGEDLDLSYRHSAFSHKNQVITALTLKLQKGDPVAVKEKMDDLLFRRKAKQPLDKPSAGSTFKRPEGYFAGALIEQCGLKGFTVGGAQISEKHAGFAVNSGGATAADILSLVEQVSKAVYEKTGVTLEPEIEMIGW